jgi:trehalose synthase
LRSAVGRPDACCITRRTRELAPPREVWVAALSPERFRTVLTEAQWSDLVATIGRAQSVFGSRAIWSVNSTARGGGVAELLQSLVGYARGAGIDARWRVIAGTPDFFALTKRLHNCLHGVDGDGVALEAGRQLYEQVSEENARDLSKVVRAGDLVLLHDPQTAGLVRPLLDLGAHPIWRCHVGLDTPNDVARSAWNFLLPYVRDAEAYVFSRSAFAWEDLDRDRLYVIPPSIDVFAAKNQPLEPDVVQAILAATGLGPGPASVPPAFTRGDGSPDRVESRAELVEDATLPGDAPVVTQVSRWDRLKDPAGVIEAFATVIAPRTDAHLVLAGPEVAAVTDDPEGSDVFRAVVAQREQLAADVRARVHLALLPMEDLEENATIVNALQRRSDVICQKSLAEGFGLTVAEAMWKSRPVVASAVGGIQDQVIDGETGVLVDPYDLNAFGRAVASLLLEPDRADELGRAAHARVRQAFLGTRHLTQYVDVFARVLLEHGR